MTSTQTSLIPTTRISNQGRHAPASTESIDPLPTAPKLRHSAWLGSVWLGRVWLVLATGVILMLGPVLASCASPHQRQVAPASALGGSVSVNADWDDVQPAVFTGGAPYGWVILRVQTSTDTLQRFEMLSVSDEPGWVQATRSQPTDPNDNGQNVPIELTANLGFFGNLNAEALVLEAVRQRLIDLRGVHAAPLR